jgi:N-acetylglucosaminyldiphosphoundecaprenol N-acetyl-beta-D-mannosaminyltransferase
VNLLGIPIDFLDMKSIIGTILVAARQQEFFQVATVNVDFLVNSRRDREVCAILTEDHLNIPDGAPVVWAGKVLGKPGAMRVAGADLVPALVSAAAAERLRVFLLGGEDGAASTAAAALKARDPGLHISVLEPPRSPLNQMDNASILTQIREVDPHILMVAFGHPKQDKWIHRHRSSLPMAAIGVGCSFDLIAGKQTRAPAWMQTVGLEWAYRLAREPRRLVHRYAIDGLWVAACLFPWVMFQWISQGRR